jgi:hypothetical protein
MVTASLVDERILAFLGEPLPDDRHQASDDRQRGAGAAWDTGTTNDLSMPR